MVSGRDIYDAEKQKSSSLKSKDASDTMPKWISLYLLFLVTYVIIWLHHRMVIRLFHFDYL